MSPLKIYTAPRDAVGNDDYTVKVRTKTGSWEEVFVYEVTFLD
ncbi:hypothetical protein [Halalkalibacterium halodurans]|nr:hypothetical protein [Halalkalibacterium halodurans]MDY7223273.1 hypothetical protein [Halalkalibacterium halodurans]MDY7242494.1 hypothetical protein [Halalkalibacterium halodurans]